MLMIVSMACVSPASVMPLSTRCHAARYPLPRLVAHDCFELGRLAYNKADWYHAVKWMQQAVHELDAETTPVPSIDRALTLDYFSYATYMVSARCDVTEEQCHVMQLA